jgi:acyl carrier protein
MSIRSTIIAQITDIAEQQRKRLPPLTDDLAMLDSGLDSLCIAILVASLEDKLGLDPFEGDGPATFPVTVGDFIRMYENAAA